jgi:hypothetical protein
MDVDILLPTIAFLQSLVDHTKFGPDIYGISFDVKINIESDSGAINLVMNRNTNEIPLIAGRFLYHRQHWY